MELLEEVPQPVVDRALWNFSELWSISSWLSDRDGVLAVLLHEARTVRHGQCEAWVEHSQNEAQCWCSLSCWCARWAVPLSTASGSQLLADRHTGLATGSTGRAGGAARMWQPRLPVLSRLPVCIQQLGQTSRSWSCHSVISESVAHCVHLNFFQFTFCASSWLPMTAMKEQHERETVVDLIVFEFVASCLTCSWWWWIHCWCWLSVWRWFTLTRPNCHYITAVL